jgi:hypothetical protein
LGGSAGLHGGIALATRDVFGREGLARLPADEQVGEEQVGE